MYKVSIIDKQATDLALKFILQSSTKEDGKWKINASPLETMASEILVNLVEI